MMLARVEGSLTATRKHPSLQGWRMVICQPISSSGAPESGPVVAIDAHGAALHQRVIVSTDGLAAHQPVGDPKSLVRMTIIAIVDEPGGG